DGSQRLLARHEPQLEEADLSHAPDPRRAIREWGAGRIRSEYELGTTPPWRFALLRGGPELHGVTILFHHTIMDGWGTTLVLKRWAELYNALREGREAAPAGASYLQFVEETRKYQAGPGYARDGDYWLKQLGDPPEPLIERRHHGVAPQGLPPAHIVSHGMEHARYARLGSEAAARGLTPFVCFLAGLALYLSRSTGKTELLIGVPCLNRLGQKFRLTPGMFVGVMPLRLSLKPGMCAGDLLAHAAHQLAEGLRHSRYPLSELGRQLQLMRLGRDSLLEVMISFERQDYALSYGAARLTDPYQLFNGWARYPLAITVCEFAADDAELARDPALVIEASAACFSADESALLAQRLWWTTQQLIGPAERRLDDIAVMTPAEAAALVAGLHKDLAQHPSPQSFVEQFEQQAALRPQSVALVWDEGQLSYAELNQRAERLATALHAAGAAPERIVATALPRSPELVVALLAIAKSGAAFLPMNPEAPPSRLREILNDSGAMALMLPQVTDSALTELHPLVLRVRPVLGAEPAGPALPTLAPAWRRAAPQELAYVLYTSGSTGGAKGVLMPHASLSRRLSWLARHWGIDSRDRAAQTTQPSFDPALIELLLPLTVGASVALPPPGRLHPRRLAEFILRHGATFCALVPSTLAGLLSGLHGREGLKLRVACCGGEVLPAELANRFISETGARLYNVYGPTEAAIFATAWPCVTSPADTALPLGRPIDDTRIYVLDAAYRPLPFGVAGEVWIGGGGLARGYLGRPELDREAFVGDPFVPGGRMYRTGDRGWLDPHGQLHFAGRADRQIKLRGYRIEPGDIELACLALPGVEQAYVEKIERNGSPRLHAWIGGSSTQTSATLLAALRERLPD
ncbi:amino acid adenylation domain-containing protein, partial [Pelomonas sp. KK5]|uniref:non-ribosomal peptide synthetase n=1 Tax=Pelomonas sp. KK5 TaxID=1855730 RepID=UPI001180AD74